MPKTTKPSRNRNDHAYARPIITTPPPITTTTAPIITTPAPIITTSFIPQNEHTYARTIITTSAPNITTSAPIITTPAPIITTPAPTAFIPQSEHTYALPIIITPSPIIKITAPIITTTAPTAFLPPSTRDIGVQCVLLNDKPNTGTTQKISKKKIEIITKRSLKSKGHSDSMIKKILRPRNPGGHVGPVKVKIQRQRGLF